MRQGGGYSENIDLVRGGSPSSAREQLQLSGETRTDHKHGSTDSQRESNWGLLVPLARIQSD